MDESSNHPTPPDPRHVLAAVVRQHGRVRVTEREMREAVKGQLGLKPLDGGGWLFEWRGGDGS